MGTSARCCFRSQYLVVCDFNYASKDQYRMMDNVLCQSRYGSFKVHRCYCAKKFWRFAFYVWVYTWFEQCSTERESRKSNCFSPPHQLKMKVWQSSHTITFRSNLSMINIQLTLQCSAALCNSPQNIEWRCATFASLSTF